LLDVTLPLPAEAAQLDLLVDGAVVDSRKAAATAPRAAALTARRDAAAHEFNWDSGGSPQDGHTYTIQISADNGATWTTLATGVKTPRYRLDHDQVPGQSRVLLRVVATDGFRSSIVRSDAIDLT